MKKLLLLFILLNLNSSCVDEKNYIPLVSVNIDLDLNLPEYEQLNIIGSSIFITGGVQGIIVYHFAINEYKIYDRNCSYEPSLDCAYIDSINTSIAYCGCCTSAFLLDQDGSAANAPALLPLKKYNWNLQEEQLYIFN